MRIPKRSIALVFGLLGLGILFFTLHPVVAFNLGSTTRLDGYLSPVPDIASVDYTDPGNWFEGDLKGEDFAVSSVAYYNLSISKLGIKDAIVSIGGEDLADSLIQYPGTALPGKTGNAVIFGHSILPQFYDPKNYLAIFSTLPSMRRGDEIEVFYDSILYQYRVEDVFEVLPSDLEILAQDRNDSYLTLVTCVPPGHPLRPKRLIVRAKLIPFGAT